MHEFKVVVGSRQLTFACDEVEANEAESAAELLNEEIRSWIARTGSTSSNQVLALAGLSLASESPRIQGNQARLSDTSPGIDRDRAAEALTNLAEALEEIASNLETLETQINSKV